MLENLAFLPLKLEFCLRYEAGCMPINDSFGRILLYSSTHKTVEDRRIGPGLKNIKDRLPQSSEAYFLNYVRNNEKVYQSGDAYAIKVINDFNGLLMPAFDHVLNEEQVKEIYKFLNKK